MCGLIFHKKSEEMQIPPLNMSQICQMVLLQFWPANITVKTLLTGNLHIASCLGEGAGANSKGVHLCKML